MVKKGGFLVVLFLVVSVYAQEPFEIGDQPITPPPPPETDGKHILTLEVHQYDSQKVLADIHIAVEIDNEYVHTNTLQYAGENGQIELLLDKGEYTITLKVDRVESKGRDYFLTFDAEVVGDSTRTINLLPVGSVIGNVISNDQVVENAIIKFNCGNSYGETKQARTDEFGSFSAYWLPLGSCRISAVSKGRVGYADVDIKAGELGYADITLTKSVRTVTFATVLLVLAVATFFTLGGSYFITRKPKTKKFSNRSADILATLGDKERSIAEYLLDNGHKASQAKIRYGVGIPKTSLARILNSLEQKNIISIERIGKLKKVSLTEWFLGNGKLDRK